MVLQNVSIWNKINFRNWPTICIFLSFVDEHLANYYRYYRRYAPKVDIRIVIAVSLTIISAIQVHIIWIYSKTCLIGHLCNPFHCVIRCWFSLPILPFSMCFYCVIWHPVYSDTKMSLPVHFGLDRFYMT